VSDEHDGPPDIPELQELARALATRHEDHIEEALGLRRSTFSPATNYPPEGLVAGRAHPWLRARLHEIMSDKSGGMPHAALKAFDLLREFPDEKDSVEAAIEGRARRDPVLGSLFARHLLGGGEADHAWLARIMAGGTFVGTILEEIATTGIANASLVAAAKEAIAANRLGRGDLNEAEFWLKRIEKPPRRRSARKPRG
jgi:hypothetical protein